MSRSVNKVILVGTIGVEPEVRHLESGAKVATFPLATSTGGYTTRDGKQIPEKTTWHNIVAWRSFAEMAEKYFTKGMRLHLEGQISYREYDKNGVTCKATDIIVTDIVPFFNGEKKKEDNTPRPAPQPQTTADRLAIVEPEQDSDDLPF